MWFFQQKIGIFWENVFYIISSTNFLENSTKFSISKTWEKKTPVYNSFEIQLLSQFNKKSKMFALEYPLYYFITTLQERSFNEMDKYGIFLNIPIGRGCQFDQSGSIACTP